MALYVFHREQILKYYKELIEFSLASREKEENSHMKSALNLNVILSLACFVEGYMEKTSKCILGYYRLLYNEINIPEFELRKPMNRYFGYIESDFFQRISQSNGIENYDRLFKLLLGESFRKKKSFQPTIESIQVLFQLRNVIAHAREVSAYEVRAYWTNNMFEENFSGEYKKAEDYLFKKGIIKNRFLEAQNAELFFTDSVADHFYSAVQQFVQQLNIFVEENLEIGEALLNKLNEYNSKHSANLSVMDFCEMHAHAIFE